MKGIEITLIGLIILSILPANNIIYSQEKIPGKYDYNECSNPSDTYPVGDLSLLYLSENKSKFSQPNETSLNSGKIYLDSAVMINEFQGEIIPYEETETSNNFQEESLELENWMMDYEWMTIEEIAEGEMELEEWMISPQNW